MTYCFVILATLANQGVSGLLTGKRDAELKGFFDSITNALNQVFNTVLAPALTNTLQTVSSLGANLLLGVGKYYFITLIK